MAILDTDILVALLKGASEAVSKIKSIEEQGDRISTTAITAYELFKGARISHKAQENLLQVGESLSALQILGLSYNAFEEASKIYLELRKAGTLIGEFDILIAGIAKTSNEVLVTRDEHFRLIKGIKLSKW